jgi:hypothetical protein
MTFLKNFYLKSKAFLNLKDIGEVENKNIPMKHWF